MADRSKIEWLSTVNPDGSITPGATWNPIVGCDKVSSGCAGCYAVDAVARVAACQGPDSQYHELTMIRGNGVRDWTGEIAFFAERLLQPLRWRRPRKIFVNSLSDLFHPGVSDYDRNLIFGAMAAARQHTFIVLTKRPDLMRKYMADRDRESKVSVALKTLFMDDPKTLKLPSFSVQGLPPGRLPDLWPLPNVWMGVSVEDQRAADERVPLLLQTPAAVRFLSCEPLLGAVELRPEWLRRYRLADDAVIRMMPQGFTYPHPDRGEWVHHNGSGIDWVICGGESGDKARPMHPDWARSLRDQCVGAGVPFFHKQNGEWIGWEHQSGPFWKSIRGDEVDAHGWPDFNEDPPGWRDDYEDQVVYQRVGKHAAGRDLDGRTWDEFPAVAGGVS